MKCVSESDPCCGRSLRVFHSTRSRLQAAVLTGVAGGLFLTNPVGLLQAQQPVTDEARSPASSTAEAVKVKTPAAQSPASQAGTNDPPATENAPAADSSATPAAEPSDPTVPQGTLRLKVARPTIAEIRETFPGASNEFILRQVEAGTTLDEMRVEWSRQQNERMIELAARQEQLAAELEKLRQANTALDLKNKQLEQRLEIQEQPVPEIKILSRIITASGDGIARLSIDGVVTRVRSNQEVPLRLNDSRVFLRAEEISADAIRLRLLPADILLEL